MEAEVLETIQIVRTPDVLGGKPRIKGHRISVQLIAELHEQAGKSVDEIIQQMPTINRAEVHAALSYYYAHREEIDAQALAEEQALANDPNVIHISAADFLAGKADLELTPQE